MRLPSVLQIAHLLSLSVHVLASSVFKWRIALTSHLHFFDPKIDLFSLTFVCHQVLIFLLLFYSRSFCVLISSSKFDFFAFTSPSFPQLAHFPILLWVVCLFSLAIWMRQVLAIKSLHFFMTQDHH